MNTEKHIEIIGHKMIINPADIVISRKLKEGIIYEKSSIEVIKNKVKKGQIFVNLGANIGYFTLILACTVGKKGKGYSFEPDPDNFKFLKKNIELNEYENVTLEQLAVGDRSGVAYLYLNNKGNPGDHRIWEEKEAKREKKQISMVSLDDYFEESNEQIDFIKMDIQGAEALALKGMKNILIKNKNLKILMEFWPYGLRGSGFDPLEMIIDLTHYGFCAFDICKDGILKKIDIIKALKEGFANYKKHKNFWWEKTDKEIKYAGN